MIVFFPCYSIESLSLERPSREANELLSGFSALFHPALIEKFDELPRWENASSPLSDLVDKIVVVPPCCDSMVGDRWFDEMKDKETIIVRNISNREEIVNELLERSALQEHGFDVDFVGNFLAIGTGYLLTELMTRQLRYMSVLDTNLLHERMKTAIELYRKNEKEKLFGAFQDIFELLTQSKEYCFPSAANLIDLVLLAKSTLGENFRELLQRQPASNIYVSAEVLREMAEKEPFSLAMLKRAVLDMKAEIIADDLGEWPLYMLPVTEIADRVLAGREVYTELLGKPPEIYGRGTIGLSPVLPQILKLAGYSNVIQYAPIDGWEIQKNTEQSKQFWQGFDGTKLGALSRYPLNALEADSYFKIADGITRTMNNDPSSTIVFARYPGQNAIWLEDLRRMDTFSYVIGRFVKLDDYFEENRYNGTLKQYGFDDFRTNRLSRDLRDERPDSISNWQSFYELSVTKTLLSAARAMLSAATNGIPSYLKDGSLSDEILKSPTHLYERLCASLFSTLEETDSFEPKDRDRLGQNFEKLQEVLAKHLCAAITGRAVDSEISEIEKTGILLLNPFPFARTVHCDVSHFPNSPEPSAEGIKCVKSSGNQKEVIAEIPPLGFLWLGPGKEDTVSPQPKTKKGFLSKMFGSRKSKGDPPMIEKIEEVSQRNLKKERWLLRNDYFEARIDAQSGILQSVFTFGDRSNRFSIQPAMRMNRSDRNSDPRREQDRNRGYTILAADSIEIEKPGPLSAILRIEGRMMKPDGVSAADFVQKYIVRRLSKTIETTLEITPHELPAGKPWDSYFCFRNVWGDPSLELKIGIHDAMYPSESELIQAPNFVDLRDEKKSITLLNAGLTYHRNLDERSLDTLLIVKGETETRFRFGIAFDEENPVRTALSFYREGFACACPAPKIISAWMFHSGRKNVNIIRYEPVFTSDTLSGLRLWLQETHGSKTTCPLSVFRPVESARKMNFAKEELGNCELSGNEKIEVPLHAYELAVLEIRFKIQN